MKAQSLAEIWSYRELFYFLVWRDVKVKYKQSLLGAGWAILQPLLAMIVFTIFMGRLAGIQSDGIPYPLFAYSALLLWTYVSGTVNLAANSVVSSANMITKIYFPRIALPFASVLSGLVDFAIASLALVGFFVYYGVQPTWWLLLVPVFVLAGSILAAGVGMFFAALNVRYRDVKYAVPFGIQLWFFASPVIYPASLVPERWRPLLGLNPFAGIVDGFRACMFPGRGFDLPLIGTSMLITLLVFILGLAYFRSAERAFADVI